MWRIEINGNLEGKYGLKNYKLFEKTVLEVYSYFWGRLSDKFPKAPELYIDNATENSGYTPVTTPVLEKYIIIKLCVLPDDSASRIAFQFAHELMHYVFYAKYGMKKEKAWDREESICTAASLIYLHDTDFRGFELQNNHVKTLDYAGYREGSLLAGRVGYDFNKLVELV